MDYTQHKSGLYIREGTMDDYVIKEQNGYRALPITNEDIVLDLGGHIGAFARWAIDKGAKGVYSFEPEPGNFALLQKNIEGFPIQAYQAAVVHHHEPNETLWINSGKNTGNHSVVSRRGRGSITVDAYNFSDIIENLEPTIIKIDIEGGEFAIQKELTTLPSFIKAIAMEIHFVKKEFLTQGQFIADKLSEQFTVLKQPVFKNTLWYTLGIWGR